MKTNEKTNTERMSSLGKGTQMTPQKIARLTGVLFVITYITSIPPVLFLYGPLLNDPRYILGGGAADNGLALGALLELLLIIANIGPAVALYTGGAPPLPARVWPRGQRLGLGRVVGADPHHREHRHRRRALSRRQAGERDPRPGRRPAPRAAVRRRAARRR